ncbi:MAG: hypothetical protein NTX15_07960 [Candidatus Kapabacteria bacterium]|nr:hypothetical protein [Candidatus Kapabacteria bacterium]
MTIAIPTRELAEPILTNIREVCAQRGWEIRSATLDQCGKLLLNNSVEMALTSPLGYGLGVGKVDYRIVPGPCVALQDYTNAFGIWFPDGGRGLATYSSPEPGSFPTLACRMVMAEKFDVVLTDAPDGAMGDCVIGPVTNGLAPAIDVGEEWFDLIESPLPIAVWVVRVDAEENNVDEAIALFADERLLEHNVSEVVPPMSDRMPREGKVLYRWTSDVEEGLDAALHTMFYHQILPEIPAIKLYGKD